MKVPAGGVASRSSFKPQHARVLFVRIAQLFQPPALRARKLPMGGLAWPWPFRPQQASVASVLIPQVWKAASADAS